jgi:hypothetical protein
VAPGTYLVVLTVDGTEYKQPLRVEGDAAVANPLVTEEEDEDEMEIDP